MFTARSGLYILLFTSISSAALGERLSSKEALELFSDGRWTFSCQEETSGKGHMHLISERDALRAAITVKGNGWVAPTKFMKQPIHVLIEPTPVSFPKELKQSTVCGSILGVWGCFIVDKLSTGFRLSYFKGPSLFGGFSGPSETDYCVFRRVSAAVTLRSNS